MDEYKQKAILEVIEWAASQGIALHYASAEQVLDKMIKRVEHRFLYGDEQQDHPPVGIFSQH
jgi:hypothetical protein